MDELRALPDGLKGQYDRNFDRLLERKVFLAVRSRVQRISTCCDLHRPRCRTGWHAAVLRVALRARGEAAAHPARARRRRGHGGL